MSDIEMHRVPGDDLPDGETLGQFCWRDVDRDGTRERRILYTCPRTPKGHLCGVPVLPARLQNGAGWQFDGNEDRPTLTPSIHCTGGCGWHGFIAAGWMRDA